MFLSEPEPTQIDWRFRIFGVDVRVHPLFWLVSALFGQPLWGVGVEFFLLWIACSFLSILVHELGHVFAGRFFGADGHIVLYSFGGLAIGSRNLAQRWARIVVSAAGPGAQFVLFGAVWLVEYLWLPQLPVFGLNRFLLAAFTFLWWINLFWPLFNLLPVWPLDGGMISREVFTGLLDDRGLRISLGISLVTAGVLAVNAALGLSGQRTFVPYAPTGIFSVVFFGALAFGSFQALQQLDYERRQMDDRWDWGDR